MNWFFKIYFDEKAEIASIQIQYSPDGSGNPFYNLTGFKNLLGYKKIATHSRNMETKKAQAIRFK